MAEAKKKHARPGEEFEAQFMASIPPGIYFVKLAAQSPAAFALPIVEKYLAQLGPIPEHVERAMGRSRFSPKAPYDLMIAAPSGYPAGEITATDHLGRAVMLPVLPLQIFALEMKSTNELRLPFDSVRPHQQKGLTNAGKAGQVAGVIVEFRATSPGEVWFIPVQSWLAFQGATTAKSLSIDMARRIGMQIQPDTERGSSRPYWKVGDWLRACGASIPVPVKIPRPPSRRPAPAAQEVEEPAPAPFGQPGLF